MTDEPTVPASYAASLFDLSGRVAVVTGGGSGLGAAISIGYAQVGVTVVVADMNMAGAEATRATIAEQGGKAEVAALDVTKRERASRWPKPVKRDHGSVDILVNSAGSAFRSPAEEFPEEQVQLHPRSQSQGHLFLLPGLWRQ